MSRAAKTLRVASVNVNGIRAAYRKDMATWLAGRDVDILCLQEVRAPDKIVRELSTKTTGIFCTPKPPPKDAPGYWWQPANTPTRTVSF